MGRVCSILIVVLVSSPLAIGQLPGSGTEADPYRIESFDHFSQFADSANADAYWAEGVYIRLMDDIDLDPALPGRETYATAVIAPDTVYDGPSFSGIFDGNGNKVVNIRFTYDDGIYIGLFGAIGSAGTVKNLTVDGYVYEGRGSRWIGGICALNLGVVDNCSVINSTITGSSTSGGVCGENNGIIRNSVSKVSIEDGSWYVGGLCGQNADGHIIDCHSDCTVEGDSHVGGLVGDSSSGEITNCYSEGLVSGSEHIGGLVGNNGWTSIESCFSKCNVEVSSGSGGLFGGLVGSNYEGPISNCYSSGDVTGGNAIGGLVGKHQDSLISNSYSSSSVAEHADYHAYAIGGLVGHLMGDANIVSSYFLYIESGGGPDNGFGEPLSDLEMRDQARFIDWDFDTIWGLDFAGTWVIPGNPYPELLWNARYYDIAVNPVITLDDPVTSAGTSQSLPVSITEIPDVNETFYVEIWSSDVGQENTGVSGVYTDIEFSDEVEILSIHHTSTFNFLTSGGIAGQRVTEFGGAALPTGGGIEPEWTLIGWVTARLRTSVSAVSATVESGTNGSVAALGRGLIPWALVAKGQAYLYKDCNGNGISDEIDILTGTSLDCNGNGVPDECDIATGYSLDCNGNGVPDECDIAYGTSTDVNRDGVPDDCQAAIEIATIAVSEPPYYTSESRSTLPDSMSAIGRSSMYYVEFWAKSLMTDSNGLLDFSVDMIHDSFNSVLSLGYNSSLRQIQGQINVDRVDDFGGQFVLSGKGISPEWIRLGWLEMRANLESDSPLISLQPGGEEISEYLISDVPVTHLPPSSNIRIQTDESSVGIAEEGSGVVDVWLSQPPLDMNVPIEVEAILHGDSDVVLVADPLIFDSNDFNQPQQLFLSAGHDSDSLDDRAVLVLTGWQDGLVFDTKAVSVRVEDNEPADPCSVSVRIRTNSSNMTFAEGDTRSIKVWLSRPPRDTNIPIEMEAVLNGDSSIVFQSNPVLSFEDPNWEQRQELVLSADHDMDLLDDSAMLILIGRQDGLVVDTKAVPVQVNDDDLRTIPWEYVNLHDLDMEIVPPLRTYDLDDDDSIGLGDLSFFAVSWQQDVPPGNELHDFDFDGFVGPGDLSWFVTGWGKGVDDMSIVYPPYEPQAKAKMASARSKPISQANGIETEPTLVFSSSKEKSAPPAANADVAVAATLTETASASDSLLILADSVDTVVSGTSYILELWVSDVGQVNRGITSVYIDVNCPSDIFDVAGVSYGSTFDMFTEYESNAGLLENLGGSTLDPGIAVEPSWIRFGVVELEALSDADASSIELMPSQLGISAYGRGKVPWEFVQFIQLPSYAEGDFDRSGRVELTDFAILGTAWQSTPIDENWDSDCDLDGDEHIGAGDLAIACDQWMEGI